MKTLTGKAGEVNELDSKRFYFQGKIEVDCPNCKEKMIRDFSDNYLSYPEIGKEDGFSIGCNKCDKYYTIPFVLKSIDVVFDYDDTKIKEQ